jgi:hypothetical protein
MGKQFVTVHCASCDRDLCSAYSISRISLPAWLSRNSRLWLASKQFIVFDGNELALAGTPWQRPAQWCGPSAAVDLSAVRTGTAE